MATATNRSRGFAAAALALLLVAACEGRSSDSLASTAASERAATSGSPSALGHAIADLRALDPRRPVPLQPMMAWHQKQNMQEHLVAIQRITDGVAREDWEGIADAATGIESSPQMQQMCEHMGAGAEGFTELALEFHRRADAIGPAAQRHDAQGVLQATAYTLEACTSCHARYRQEVVDTETWTRWTGQVHEPAMRHDGR